MLSLPTLFRDAAPAVLQSYLVGRGVQLPDNEFWSTPIKQRIRRLHDLYDQQPDPIRATIFDDAQRVLAMADEGGVRAVSSIGAMTDELIALDNDVTRMLTLLMNAPNEFAEAEQARYADDKRLGSMWDGFIGPAGIAFNDSDAAKDNMENAVREYFKSPLAEVEPSERSRPGAAASERLIQITIFREGRPNTRRAFVNGQVDRVPEKPVLESVVTYEPASGTIEVIASTRADRLALARMFAEHMLDASIDGKRIALKEYQLDHLRRPYPFARDPVHKIASVRVVRMVLTSLDVQGESICLETPAREGRSIWQMSSERFGPYDPLMSGFRIREVLIKIWFAPDGRRGPRLLNVRIKLPRGSNVKERTERERLIGSHYLSEWGIVQPV